MRTSLAISQTPDRAAAQPAMVRRIQTLMLIVIGSVFACFPTPMMANDLPRLVLFDIELNGASHEGQIDGVREDQSRRLETLNVEVGKLFAKTGSVINHMHTNIRGNTGESWLRGLRWLNKNRLKPKE